MTAGALLLVAALALFAWNRWDDSRAASSASGVLAQLLAQVDEASSASSTSGFWVEIDGYRYVGYVSAPSIGMELPVMASWSYEQLRIAPCLYAGSAKTDDLVICAHNYSSHFGSLSSLSIGDAVYFTDTAGTSIAYEVIEIETLSSTAVEAMTDSGYDLTLFTCNYSGQARVTVRCDRA